VIKTHNAHKNSPAFVPLASALLGLAIVLAPGHSSLAQETPPSLPPGFELPDFEIPEIEVPTYTPPEPIPLDTFPVEPAGSQTRPSSPTDIYQSDVREVGNIERLAYTDKDAARQRAIEARTRLQAQRDVQVNQEQRSQQRADGWEELAAGTESDAARNRQRAQESLGDISSPGLTEDDKAERRRQAEFWEEQARGDDKRAAERRAEAAVSVKEAEAARDRVALLDELIDRLDKVIAEESEDATVADGGATSQQPQTEPDEKPVRADYEISLEDSLGIWRPADDASHAMVIVQKSPDSDSFDLQLHTDDRVWEGKYHTFFSADARADKPRLTFEYTPKADEMNPEIPTAAREAVEGQLVWRIEAYEIGSQVEPELSFNFFRGRVRWKDDDPADARVDGDGPPKLFDARKDVVLATRLAAPTLLFVTLANQRHDPSLRTIEAVTQGMPLRVNVVMSSTSAKESGSSISVDVASPSGGSTTLALTRQKVTEDNRVIYGHRGVITIGGNAPAREFAPFSAPPRRIYGWVLSALSGVGLGIGELEPGPRLSVLPDNGDIVEFRYGEAFQKMPVYATWVQRAVAQYDDQINIMAATYGGVLASKKPADVKAEARDRLRMLANYQVLRRSEHLTDKHLLGIAEAYLGRPNGRQVLAFSKAKLQEIATVFRREELQLGIPEQSPSAWLSLCGNMSAVTYARTLEAPNLGGRDATSEEVGDAIQRAALDWLGHNGINAVKALDDPDLEWVHPLERQCMDRVIVRASRDLLNRSLKDYGTALAFGLYEGIAMASGADDIAIAFFETDIHGNKVPQYSLPWWISTLSVSFEVAGVLDEAISLGRRGVDDDIWRIAAKDVPDDVSWSRSLIDDTMKRIANYLPVTPGKGDGFRTIVKRTDGVVTEVPEAAEEVLTSLPSTLTPAQRKQTVVEMVPADEMDRLVPDTPRTRYSDQLGDVGLGSSNAPSLHSEGGTAAQKNPSTGVVQWYGNDAKPMGDLGPEFCQVGSEHGCEGVSAAYMLLKEEGVLFSEAEIHGDMMNVFVMRQMGQGKSLKEARDTFIDAGYGHTRGYAAKDIAAYHRMNGYEVHTFNPAKQGNYNLATLGAALDQGWQIRIGIRKPGQRQGGHAVVLKNVVQDRFGRIKDVVFFCPTQGGYLKMRAEKFRQWMITNMDYDVIYAMRKPSASN